MRKFLILTILIILISLVIFYRFLPKGFTGFATKGNTSIFVSKILKGEITLVYKETIEFSTIQDIAVEFTNVGSVPLTEKIEVRIYWNNQSKLQEMAYYYDSQAILNPSQKRIYTVSFLPPQLGVYYIKARVVYDSKVVEKWGAFLVIYTPPPSPIQIITPSPPAAPPVSIEEVGVPEMSLEYPKKVEILQGESKLFSILVKNTGNVSLNNIRLSISTTSLIGVEINPKQVFKLLPSNSTIFLVSINTSKTTPLGKYPFDFEIIANEIKEGRSIELVIVSKVPSLKEEVYETILNYEYLISEIQSEIDSAALIGIDVKMPQNSLNKAKIGLEVAKGYYQQEKYEDAKSKLEEVEKYLEEAVFQLASASVLIHLPAFAPFSIVLIAIFIGIVFLLLVLLKRRRKKREKRPKLLKAVEAEAEA